MVALPLLLLYNLTITPAVQPVLPAAVITQDTPTPVSPDGLVAGGVASRSAIDLLVAVENAFATPSESEIQEGENEAGPPAVAPVVQASSAATTTQPPPSTTVVSSTTEAPATTQPPVTSVNTQVQPTTATTQAPPATTTPTTSAPVTTTTTTTTTTAAPPPATTTTTAGDTGSPIAPFAWDPSWPEIAMWDQLAVCESTTRWSANTGNGYYGGIQFSLDSWAFVGGTGRPDQASRAEQIYRGALLWELQSWRAWPGCTRIKFGWDEWQTSL